MWSSSAQTPHRARRAGPRLRVVRLQDEELDRTEPALVPAGRHVDRSITGRPPSVSTSWFPSEATTGTSLLETQPYGVPHASGNRSGSPPRTLSPTVTSLERSGGGPGSDPGGDRVLRLVPRPEVAHHHEPVGTSRPASKPGCLENRGSRSEEAVHAVSTIAAKHPAASRRIVLLCNVTGSGEATAAPKMAVA